MAFKLGRLPRNESRYAPALEDYLHSGGLEAVLDSEDVDRASKITSWPMYCNGPDPENPPGTPSGCGDCTIAEFAHAFTALGVYAGKPQVLFPASSVLKGYSDVSGFDPATGANDNGCQMQDVLAYNREVGLQDADGTFQKVLMYAALGSPRDPQLLSEVLKTFGYVYVGINCPQSAQEQFGDVWTYVPGSPIDGGHCIGLHHRQPYGSRTGVFSMATWGALQPTTLSFIAHYVEEAWAVITQDWLEANGSSCDGIALAQLEKDMKFV